ncbi:MAG: hypothetical protein AAB579_00740 [Patescibacteria group bacterium]
MTPTTEPTDSEKELERARKEFETTLPKMVYISGALTDMPEEERARLRTFYEALGRVCKEFGYAVYIPHIYGDPKLVAHKEPVEIDHMDRLAVTLSYFVVAYVGVPSLGVGIEIEMAHHAHKPVVLLYEKAKLAERRISRLVRGNPAVSWQISFTDFANAAEELRAFLKERSPFGGLPEQLPLPLCTPRS